MKMTKQLFQKIREVVYVFPLHFAWCHDYETLPPNKMSILQLTFQDAEEQKTDVMEPTSKVYLYIYEIGSVPFP